MQEMAVTDIDADMTVEPRRTEEHQVSGFQFSARDRQTFAHLIERGARQLHGERVTEDLLHQGRALDATDTVPAQGVRRTRPALMLVEQRLANQRG